MVNDRSLTCHEHVFVLRVVLSFLYGTYSLMLVLTIIISVGQTATDFSHGLYGNPEDLGAGVCILLIIQLFPAALLVILLHEVSSSGYGIRRSAESLFLATTMCKPIVKKTLSNVASLLSMRDSGSSVRDTPSWDDKLLSARSLSVTATIIAVVIYRQRADLAPGIYSIGFRKLYKICRFPICSHPFIERSVITSLFFLLSQTLASWFPNNIFVNTLGIWEVCDAVHKPPVSNLTSVVCTAPKPTQTNLRYRILHVTPAGPYDRPSLRCYLYHVRLFHLHLFLVHVGQLLQPPLQLPVHGSQLCMPKYCDSP